jgi:O-antigen ligase
MLAAIVLLLGASGSRGGILAGAVGLLVVVWFLRRSVAFALTAAAAVLVVLAGSLAVTPLLVHLPGAAPTYIPTTTAAAAPTTKRGSATTTTKTAPTAPARYTAAELRIFAEDPMATTNELGRPLVPGQLPQRRNLFTSSGRVEAWLGAIHQGNQRPLLGYGFGTEDRVFVDRWYSFDGARPENTFIGTYLQLGVVGVLAVCALLGWAVLAGARALVSLPAARRRLVAAVAGVVAAGLTEMLVQSFATSAGDIAMLSFWVCLGLFATSSEWADS